MNTSKVFQLIKSLTPNEKRFFKIYSNRHIIGAKNKYVILFEILDKLEEEHDEKIIQQLKKQGQGKFISSEKNYLHNHLLNVLNIYHTGTTAESKLGNLLQSIELLLGKALYNNCSVLLKKAKKIAYSYDRFEYVLIIIKHERSIADRVSSSLAEEKNVLQKLLKEELRVLEILKEQVACRNISDTLFTQVKNSGIAKTESDLKGCRNIYSNPLLKNENALLSYDAKRFFLSAHIYYYYIINNAEKGHLYRRKLVQLLESNWAQIREHPKHYIAGLNNILLSSIQLLKRKDFFIYLNKMREVPNKISKSKHSHFIRIRIFESSFINETDYYIRTREFEKGVRVAMQIEKMLPEYRNKMDKSSEIILHFNMMSLYFNAGQYHKALKCSNHILDSKWNNIREDLISFSKISNLLIHYELGNYMELPYYLKSTYRHLHSRNLLFKYEKVILKYIEKIVKSDSSNLKSIFTEMKSELENLKNDPLESIIRDDIDIMSWIKEKIKKIDLEKNRNTLN